MRICSICKFEKEETEFYICDKQGHRYTYCKTCHAKKRKIAYEANKEANDARAKARRAERLAADPEGTRKREAENAARWRQKNLEASRASGRRSDAKRRGTPKRKASKNKSNAAYRGRHPDRIKKGNAIYREKNKELLKRRHKEWRDAHPEANKAIHARWKAANKEKVNAATHRRRYALAKAEGFYTPAEWIALKTLCDYRCLWCGKSESELNEALAFDHIVPVSKGGGNTIANGQPMCRVCNSKKHTAVKDLRPRWIRAIVEAGLLLAPPEGPGGLAGGASQSET